MSIRQESLSYAIAFERGSNKATCCAPFHGQNPPMAEWTAILSGPLSQIGYEDDEPLVLAYCDACHDSMVEDIKNQ